MRLIVSFSTTHFTLLKKQWNNYNPDNKSNITEDKNINKSGLVALINWDTGLCERIEQIPRPFGVLKTQGGFCILCHNSIQFVDSDLKPVSTIRHSLLNNLHSGCKYDNGYLITSSGIDSILYLDNRHNISLFWTAINDYRYTHSKQKRVLDFLIDHSHIYYPVIDHVTHLNSVYYDKKTRVVYAVLFWQGLVIKIDLDSKLHVPVFDGLLHPHSLSKMENGHWLIADTVKNKFHLMNDDWKVEKSIHLQSVDWLQDVKYTTRDTFLVADANNKRIIEVDHRGRLLKEWKYHPEWKIYEILEIG